MNYGYAPPPAKPPVSRTDLACSIILLVVTFAGGGVAAFMGLFMMAFTDYCPATCNIEAGVNALVAGFIVAAVLGVAGTVITVIRLTMRATAWPFAVCTLGVCALACIAAIAGYLTAVGG